MNIFPDFLEIPVDDGMHGSYDCSCRVTCLFENGMAFVIRDDGHCFLAKPSSFVTGVWYALEHGPFRHECLEEE